MGNHHGPWAHENVPDFEALAGSQPTTVSGGEKEAKERGEGGDGGGDGEALGLDGEGLESDAGRGEGKGEGEEEEEEECGDELEGEEEVDGGGPLWAFLPRFLKNLW